jgi:site-specific recombinase XerD
MSFTVRGQSIRIEFAQYTGERATATARGRDLEDSWRIARAWHEEIEAYRKAEKLWHSPGERRKLDAETRLQQDGPTVQDALAVWLGHHLARAKGDKSNNTYRSYESIALLFCRCLDDGGHAPAEIRCGELDDEDIRTFVVWLRDPANSQRGKGRVDTTVEFYVASVLSGLRWIAKHKDFKGDWVPPDLPADIEWKPLPITRIPSLHMTARVALAATGWLQQALTLAYYTGLRASQIMGLRWGDVDLEAGDLVFPGHLGKSKQEGRGRRVPMSPYLVEALRRWAEEDEVDVGAIEPEQGPYIVNVARGRGRRRPKEGRELRSTVVKKLWKDLNLWNPAYTQPIHCFRAALANGLILRGTKVAAVSRLLGHSLGFFTIERYTTEDESLRPDMLRAVAMIPALEVAAADALIGQPPPSLARFLTACSEEHQGALAALANGNLPAGRGPQETAVLLRSLAAQLDELGPGKS